jgi:hypothetical protein
MRLEAKWAALTYQKLSMPTLEASRCMGWGDRACRKAASEYVHL